MPTAVRRRRLTLPETGIEIALLDWGGEGPPALLHHANGFCAGTWGLVAEGLRRRYRVIAMDARGHGDSSKPRDRSDYTWDRFAADVVAVAEIVAREAGERRVALGLGHSFGGTSILAAAARRPALFERIALVDPVIVSPALASSGERRRERGPELAAGARRRRQIWASREEARAWWAGRGFFRSWDPRALALYAEWGLRDRDDGRVELRCSGEVEAMVFEMSASLDPFALAPDVRAPALILWAAKGDFPRATYQALATRMPDARILDLEVGHLVPMERPDRVVSAVLAFASEGAGEAQCSTG